MDPRPPGIYTPADRSPSPHFLHVMSFTMPFVDRWKLHFCDSDDVAPYHHILHAIAGMSASSVVLFSYYGALTQLGAVAPAPHVDVAGVVEHARRVANGEALSELLEHLRAATSFEEIEEVLGALKAHVEGRSRRSKSDLESYMNQSDAELFSFAVKCNNGEVNIASPKVPQLELLASTAESPFKGPPPAATVEPPQECVMSDYEDFVYCEDLRTAM